jgi:hypothetical protein
MATSGNKSFNTIYYRFKLYEDTNLDSINIDGHTFSSKDWTVYKTQPSYTLQNYVRTVLKRDNRLRYQEFNPASNEVYFDTDKYLNMTTEYYSRDVLSIFDRKKIEDICNFYGITTKNILTKALVNKILQAQETIKSREEKEKEVVTN